MFALGVTTVIYVGVSASKDGKVRRCSAAFGLDSERGIEGPATKSRTAVVRHLKMLHDARMAGLAKRR